MEEVSFLLLTIAIELPLVFGFLCKEPAWKLVLVTLSVNLITHPIAWHLIVSGWNWSLVELLVFVIEGGIFALLFSRARFKAFWVAVTINIVSAAIGILLF